jgi:spore coat polysaccharide biosynthesis protein SpsF
VDSVVRNQRRVVAIVQARMESTRLPGKVMTEIASRPIIQHVVERAQRAQRLDNIILATTRLKEDDILENFARQAGVACYRGEEQDVLARYYGAATQFQVEVIVRICSDNPLIDPQIIDKVIIEHLRSDADYTSNSMKNTFPLGLNTEIFNCETLERAYKEARHDDEREHVTPYIWRHPGKFKLLNVANDTDYSYMRWTVDTVEDLAFVRRIYDHFQNNDFTWKEVIHLLAIHPEWLEINRHVRQKAVQ